MNEILAWTGIIVAGLIASEVVLSLYGFPIIGQLIERVEAKAEEAEARVAASRARKDELLGRKR